LARQGASSCKDAKFVENLLLPGFKVSAKHSVLGQDLLNENHPLLPLLRAWGRQPCQDLPASFNHLPYEIEVWIRWPNRGK